MTTKSSTDIWVRADNDRQVASKHLKGVAEYLKVKYNTKIADGPFKTKRYRYETLPPGDPNQNIGVMPKGRTVIIDIDCNSSSLSPEEQIVALSKWANFDLSQSFTVDTPSGGKHIYLSWPKGVPLPRNGKLKSFGSDYAGDLRSSGTAGYVLLPGSVINDVYYTVANDAPIVEVSLDFAKATVDKIGTRYKRHEKKKTVEESVIVDESEIVIKKGTKPLPYGVIPTNKKSERKTLESLIESRNSSHYHPNRAAVYGALSCCGTNEQIISEWRRLNLDKDSYTDGKISDKKLMREVKHLRSKFGTSDFHKGYCDAKSVQKKAPVIVEFKKSDETDISELLAAKSRKSVEFLRHTKGWCNPHIIDLNKALIALRGNRKNESKYYSLSVALIEDFINPWTNYGVMNFILAEKFLASFYKVEVKDIHQAKKLLIRRGIIVNHLKQLPGRAATFYLAKEFVDEKLSKKLNYHTLDTENHLYINLRTGEMVNPLTGEFIEEINKVSKIADELMVQGVLPAKLSDINVHNYLLEKGVKPTPVKISSEVKKNKEKMIETKKILSQLNSSINFEKTLGEDFVDKSVNIEPSYISRKNFAQAFSASIEVSGRKPFGPTKFLNGVGFAHSELITSKHAPDTFSSLSIYLGNADPITMGFDNFVKKLMYKLSFEDKSLGKMNSETLAKCLVLLRLFDEKYYPDEPIEELDVFSEIELIISRCFKFVEMSELKMLSR